MFESLAVVSPETHAEGTSTAVLVFTKVLSLSKIIYVPGEILDLDHREAALG